MKEGTAAQRGSNQTNSQLRQETMSRMLASAVRVIAMKGATGLLMADVASDSGYSHTLPNYYFKSKTNLLRQAYENVVDDFKTGMVDCVGRRPDDRTQPGLECLLTSVAVYLDAVKADVTRARSLHVLFADVLLPTSDLLHEVRLTNQDALAFFECHIRTAIRHAEISTDVEPSVLALIVLASLRGIVSQYLTDPDSVDLDQAAQGLSRFLRKGLGQ